MCQNGATCHNTEGGYSCICVNGYEGHNCEIDVDDCAQQPCLNGGTCHDGVASYSCVCPPDKTGLLCHLNNACASNPCNAGSICETSVVNGSYTCRCPSGYTGPECNHDINECNEGKTHLFNTLNALIFLFHQYRLALRTRWDLRQHCWFLPM